MKAHIVAISLILAFHWANAQDGSIANIQVNQRTDDQERVLDIQFDLEGSATEYELSLEVSFDNGANYVAVDPAEITGSLRVAPGTGIQLVWDGRISYPEAYAIMARIRITAEAVSGTFIDTRDNQTYKWVRIGDQFWMAENLKYLPASPEPRKNGGSPLFLVGPNTESYTEPYAYVHGYDGTNTDAAKATENYQHYGALYNWPAAMGGALPSDGNPSGVQGVCPAGWHLPSDVEWTQLFDFLGGASVAGGKLKSTRTEPDVQPRWVSPNTGATDVYGFSALPGGFVVSGNFYSIGLFGNWWSSSEGSSIMAKNLGLGYNNGNVTRITGDKIFGFSVRCVRD